MEQTRVISALEPWTAWGLQNLRAQEISKTSKTRWIPGFLAHTLS